jgi:hypothetical protein
VNGDEVAQLAREHRADRLLVDGRQPFEGFDLHARDP